MFKVLLINPPQKIYNRSKEFAVSIPLGILSIASVIRPHAVVRVIDCTVEDFRVRKYKNYTHHGTDFSNLRSKIRSYKPDLVGISIPFSTQESNAIRVANMCKAMDPRTLVVFGGPHASVRYKELLRDGSCDYCIIGEGEYAFLKLLQQLKNKKPILKINGVAYIKNSKIHYQVRTFVKDLDRLPFPAYDLIDADRYINSNYLSRGRHKGARSMTMITSRGCPFGCVFCSVRLHMGAKCRYHSVEYVTDHMDFLIKRYRVRFFSFEDDNISLDRVRFNKFLDTIKKNKWAIKWSTPNGIRADTLDYHLLKKMKQSGCLSLRIGIESGSQKVLNDIIKKRLDLKKAISVVKSCHRLKMPLSAFYVVGFPGETRDQIRQTLDLALELFESYDVDPLLAVATPIFGTELYNFSVKNRLMKRQPSEQDLAMATLPQGSPLIKNKDFSKKDLRKLMDLFLRRLSLSRYIKRTRK